MSGGVDAARQPRDDGHAVIAEIAGHLLGEFDAADRGVARADNGDGRSDENRRIAANRDQRGRRVDMGTARPDIPLRRRPIRRAPSRSSAAISRSASSIGQMRSLAPAARRQIGRGLDGSGGAAEMAEEIAEGRRPDRFAADQA